MRRVLICDDEKLIRTGIIAKLRKFDMEIDEISEAENNEQAIASIEEKQPQLVITDIRMGKSNGLDMIAEMVVKYPETQFIIISGYSEFEYAEKAIRLGVCDYLLKPVSDEDLKRAVQKAFGKLAQKVETRAEDGGYFKLENLINRIFHSSGIEQEGYLAQQAEELMHLENGFYLCILFYVEDSSFEVSDFEGQDAELLKYGIRNMVMEISEELELSVQVFSDFRSDNRLILLVRDTEESRLEIRAKIFAARITNAVREHLKVNITLGVSSVSDKLERKLYQEAKKAVQNKFVQGINQIYYFSKNHDVTGMQALPEGEFSNLRRYVYANDVVGIRKSIRNILKEKNRSGEYIFAVYLNLINILVGMGEKTIALLDYKYSDYLSDDYLTRLENDKQLEEFFVSMMMLGCRPEQESFAKNCKDMMQQIKEYIDRNYMQDISVSGLAKLFNINFSYFSTIFRQEIGKTLTQYLRDVRIEKACELLKNEDINTEHIAEAVGFHDTLYFYRVFKKSKQMTPTEYRNLFKAL
ncbi:MAG: response regulator [Ruminococcaceae bacterium]|nr:response regulator [Oscillospiraceae bacterium]